MKADYDPMKNASSPESSAQCDNWMQATGRRVGLSLIDSDVMDLPPLIESRIGPRRKIRGALRTPSLLLYCVLMLGVSVTASVGTVRAQTDALSDSFTLNADLSGGNIVCSSGMIVPLAVGTQMYVPAAGSWQVGWHSTFYVTFGSSVPSTLQFIFRVFNGAVLNETVEYEVEPSLFQASTTKEFAFSVGTHGNDGTSSGIISSAPFYMTIQYWCLSTGQSVTVKGTSHILQIAWPEAYDD